MKKINLMIAGLLMAAVAVFAAGIDGKWTAEMSARNRDGEVTKVMTTFDLKASGETLTGTVATAGPRAASAEIIEGKLAGNKFSFKTKQTTKKGENIMVWEGTVDGDSLKGTRAREGANNKTEFTAKRGM
ncbi:MAG: hypothetical protein K2X03_04995 [Bryobacteraceae bacterium]|nr:hypothetical protein [Bryobacteraceae bacterium]